MAPKTLKRPAAVTEKKPAAKKAVATPVKFDPGRVPIFVMLPLDWMTDDGMALRHPEELSEQLSALKAAGVTGVMGDVWWGLCEPEPQTYRFGGTVALCALLTSIGLKFQATMAFHKCGGNVGDEVNFPLPLWAMEPARDAKLLYTSGGGVVSEDCLSLSADNEEILPCSGDAKRSPLTCYREYMKAFLSQCKDYLGSVIVELQVGMGPCGELRYPSYMLSNGWNYPGVGLVMAHDCGMLKMLANDTGLTAPPESLPKEQNAKPDDIPIFTTTSKDSPEEWGFRSGDGATFLSWYSKVLRDHGEAVLREAAAALDGEGVAKEVLELSVKVSGLHWYVMHPSRATEACAGYNCCTSSQADAYHDIAQMLAAAARKTGRPIIFNFTCLEMHNLSEDMPEALSAPEDLIAQVRRACLAHRVPLSGENALEFDIANSEPALEQMRKQLRAWSTGRDCMHAVTLLRLTKDVVSEESLLQLGKFISAT